MCRVPKSNALFHGVGLILNIKLTPINKTIINVRVIAKIVNIFFVVPRPVRLPSNVSSGCEIALDGIEPRLFDNSIVSILNIFFFVLEVFLN